MNTATDRQTSEVTAPQRATLRQASRTGRAVAALLSMLTSSVLLASVAIGMAGAGDGTPALADRGASTARA